MVKLNTLLSERFRKTKTKDDKVETLVSKSRSGDLSGFSGIFKIADLTIEEKSQIETILNAYKEDAVEIHGDYDDLMAITQEVKAINNQAIILHGERIKKAQSILKKYKDGAFTAWLVATYGNRQTPYNFLQYFEFYKMLPLELQNKMTEMPKQAVYTLASRDGELEKKQEMIESYQGESKKEVLEKIRTIFPLAPKDKRQTRVADGVISALRRLIVQTSRSKEAMSDSEVKTIRSLIVELQDTI